MNCVYSYLNIGQSVTITITNKANCSLCDYSFVGSKWIAIYTGHKTDNITYDTFKLNNVSCPNCKAVMDNYVEPCDVSGVWPFVITYIEEEV